MRSDFSLNSTIINSNGIPIFLATKLLRLSRFVRSDAWTVGVFTVHEEPLGAVVLIGCPRGAHSHPLASYFLV